MNNTELTLDQLAEIAGGLVGRTICSFKKTTPQWDVICDVGTSVQGELRTGVLLGKKGRKQTNTNLVNFAEPDLDAGDSPFRSENRF